MDFDLKQHTVLLTVAGSRAYGTHRPESDIDVKGVCIPPEEYRLGYLHRFEQADKPSHIHKFIGDMTEGEQKIIKETKLEGSIYDIRKLFSLASACNPNILDVLFCRDSEVRVSTPVGEKLREHAKDFLSTKARFTFAGYAHAQLKRINTHRKYLLNPPTHTPTREEYGIPQDVTKDKMSGALAAVRKQLDSWEIDFGEMSQGDKTYIQNQINLFLAEQKLSRDERFAAAARMIGYSENFVELLKKESQFRQASQQYKQYLEWKKSRNPERAVLEAKYGLDTKHASHLVRLYRMCHEILETGEVNVWRPDAEELLEIRNGGWSYEKLIEFADEQDAKIDELYKSSILPKRPNQHKLDKLCINLTKEFMS